MDHPVKEIPGVIHQLTEGSPSVQQHALTTYFRSSASFEHPFCRVPSFPARNVPGFGAVDSRLVISFIYRWYKILSPRIDLTVHSVAHDQKAQLLYVSISQVFSLFFVPFYKADVNLTTVLHLDHDADDNKYYITSQKDLYQTDQFVMFFWPGGDFVLVLFQLFATLQCILGALVLAPVTYLQERRAIKSK